MTDIQALNRLNEDFLEEINRSGDLYLTHTKVHGFFTLRMVIGQTYVDQAHVERALERIKEAARISLQRFKQQG